MKKIFLLLGIIIITSCQAQADTRIYPESTENLYELKNIQGDKQTIEWAINKFCSVHNSTSQDKCLSAINAKQQMVLIEEIKKLREEVNQKNKELIEEIRKINRK
jgi:hypothetical protein